MANGSKRCRDIKKRIQKLKNKYYFRERITGPTQGQMDDLRAFTLLCHAEFEVYFESLAISILDRAKKRWDSKHVANYNLACLFVNQDRIEKKQSVSTKIEKIYSDFRKSIEHNNGMKRDNILKLFEPLGYEEGDFDSAFLADIDSLGSKRGNFAHCSFKTAQIESLRGIYGLVDRIADGLVEFEEVITNKTLN
jgi:hypothetical protein